MAFKGQGQAGHGAGNAGGFMAEPAAFVHHIAVFVLEHGFGGGRRRGFPVVDGFRCGAIARRVEQEAATTDVAGAGLGDSQGKAGGYRSVYGVTAVLENLQGHFRRQCVAGGHHALGALNGMKALAFQNGLVTGCRSSGCNCEQACGCKAPQAPQRDFL